MKLGVDLLRLPRLPARSGATVSAAVHLAALGLLLVVSGVRPFNAAPVQTIAVDIVTPDAAPLPKPPAPELTLPPDKPAVAETNPPPQSPAASPAPPPPPLQQTAAEPPPSPASQTAKPAAASPPQAAQAVPPAPEPDLTEKYHVNFGLTPRPGGDFDAEAASTAKIGADDVTKFRAHLRTCSKLPEGVDAADKLKIVVRAQFARDGRLVRPPLLIEASASTKGPALMHAAIAALLACQPYTNLPAASYDQWKVLDLSFTPQDFSGG